MALNDFLSEIANAIREKKGTTAPIKATNFASEILSIQGGGGSSDLIDVTALPTTVDDSKIYRAKFPDVYVNDGTSVISLRKQIEAEGASVNVYIVDILPVVGEPAVYGSTVNLYFQESDNTPYLYMDGTWLDIATAVGDGMSYNGVVTSPSQATSVGMYFDYESDLAQSIGVPNSLGDKAIYQYTDKWEKLVKKLLSQTKTVTPYKGWQYIYPDEGYELSEVVVNPIPDEYIIPSGSRTFTENGTYDVYDYASVEVNIAKPTATLSITSNGTHNVQNYGYVNVNVSVGDKTKQKEIIERTVTTLDKEDFTGVSKIGAYAFAECSNLTSVVIPDSVTSIGSSAFQGCPIETATIPAIACRYIKNDKLKTVVITSGDKIGSYAFEYCDSLTSIEIPNSVTSIDFSAFYGCSSLTSIVIPDGVTSIGSKAFEFCRSFTTIYIPDLVTSIGTSVFAHCYNLTSISVSENNSSYKDIDGNLYTKDGKTLMQYAIGKKDTSFTIPNSVTSIGYEALIGCLNLTRVVIGNSVTSIAHHAFNSCTSLNSIEIPNSVTYIGEYAFFNCSKLTDINYSGTKAEWNAISFRTNWNENTGNYTVHCTDGDIVKS